MDERSESIPSPASASLAETLLVIVRQRRIILSVYAGVVATALAGIFLLPPQYRAAAKVLLTTNKAQISTSAERPTELVRTTVGDAELNSQLEILRSRDLVEKVLLDMGVREETGEGGSLLGAAVRAPATLLGDVYRRFHGLEDVEASSAHSRLIANIQKGIEVSAVRNSNVIEVAYWGLDPTWTTAFANHLTNEYVEHHSQMQRQTEAEDFFTKQSELLKQKLTQSEAALRDLREKAGALAGQQADVHDRLNEFSAELARTKIARAEQEERVAYLERTQVADRHAGRIATPEILQLEAKRAELLGRYRPDSERVRALDEQLQTLRSAVSAYDTMAGGKEAGAQASSVDLPGARATLAALKGKEEALAHERDEYRSQAELLEAQTVDLARLERQVKLDEEAYLSYVRTAEESRLSNALEQTKMLRLTIVEPATIPLEAVSPKKGRILAFALIGGLALSIGVGFTREYFDTTLKTAAEVRRHANLEVLAVLPERAT